MNAIKCIGINFQAPWFSKFSGEHPIPSCRRGCSAPAHHPTRPPLSWRNSAPATLQFPPATFFQFENPVHNFVIFLLTVWYNMISCTVDYVPFFSNFLLLVSFVESSHHSCCYSKICSLLFLGSDEEIRTSCKEIWSSNSGEAVVLRAIWSRILAKVWLNFPTVQEGTWKYKLMVLCLLNWRKLLIASLLSNIQP